ncbi:hypothetical protein C8R44DRAFT_783206 [Mycena epipterygia]|nr:hypothetical protein C8R44DRAFT_783206 [Mycena epipterygia]
MPVSFPVANHPAKSMPFANGREGYTAQKILGMACHDQARHVEEILQFSLSGNEEASGRDLGAKIPNLIPERNGFVQTVITAYNEHYALVIRPDDVWLAILSQFNFFVNANAELLRANFVAHEGKRELVIYAEGNRYNVDFGSMSRQMTELIEKNVVDPTLRQWVTPDFTTTTVNDVTVSAVLLMATLKAYFSYGFGCLGCGLPRVTLEGERSDWMNILGRLEKLKEYGIETIAWYHLLRPVISRFVAAFDAPESPDNVDFWQRIAHHISMGSGPSYYSGWINAFNAFSKEGAWLGMKLNKTAVSSVSPEELSAEEFWTTYTSYKASESGAGLVFDGTPYHRVDTTEVPPGYAEVDVSLDDNGEMFDCFMVAGMVGMHVSSSEDAALSPTGQDDTLQPAAGWWICTKKQNVMSEQEEQQALLRERYPALFPASS